MNWFWWRRDPPQRNGVEDLEAAQSEVVRRLRQSKAQAPKVAAAERAARVLARQTERLADDVDRVMRLRGNT